jgi:acetate kinase
MAILVLNAGSATLKAGAYDGDLTLLARALVDGTGAGARLLLKAPDGEPVLDRPAEGATRADHLTDLTEALAQAVPAFQLEAVGHRVVHGGAQFRAPTRITPDVVATLEALTPLAPLHQPASLVAIRAMMASVPDVPQVACFDTAFHASHADHVRSFALPHRYAEAGVVRYGFHGLSYASIAGQLPALSHRLATGRTVVAHLGSGCSLCAIKGGVSVDSSMGFSALDGIPMGTRPGALDAGVLLYMLQQEGLTAAQIETLLYRQSGLYGLSGLSADMRVLGTSDDPRAGLALAVFCFRTAREVAALCTALGGLDGLVFTAGIGEHDASVRARIASHLGWLGVALDDARNRAAVDGRTALRISTDAAGPEVWVIPTDEEDEIARETVAALTA